MPDPKHINWLRGKFADNTISEPFDAQAEAGDYNDGPDFWRPVQANSVKQWLAEAGLQVRLQAWLDAVAPTLKPLDSLWMAVPVNAQLVGLVGGVRAILSAGFGDELLIYPAHDNYTLLAAAVANPQVPMEQADADRLVARSLSPDFAPATAADMTAAEPIARRMAEAEAYNVRFNAFTQQQAAAFSTFEQIGTPAYTNSDGNVVEGWPALPARPGEGA